MAWGSGASSDREIHGHPSLPWREPRTSVCAIHLHALEDHHLALPGALQATALAPSRIGTLVVRLVVAVAEVMEVRRLVVAVAEVMEVRLVVAEVEAEQHWQLLEEVAEQHGQVAEQHCQLLEEVAEQHGQAMAEQHGQLLEEEVAEQLLQLLEEVAEQLWQLLDVAEQPMEEVAHVAVVAEAEQVADVQPVLPMVVVVPLAALGASLPLVGLASEVVALTWCPAQPACSLASACQCAAA